MKLTVGFSTRKRKLPFNYLVEWFEGTPYSHTFISYEDQVFQATGKGVNIISKSEFLDLYLVFEEIEYELTEKQANLYEGFVNGCIGKEYSFLQLLMIVISTYFGLIYAPVNTTEKYICSELCADVLSFVLEMKFPKAHDYITPKELLKYLRS